MKFLLVFTILFFGNSYAQEVLKKKGRKALISNDGLDLDKGSIYYFSNGDRKVKVKVLKASSSKFLVGIIKGKISKGDSLELLSSSSSSSRSSRSQARSGHSAHRFYGGLSYLMGGELTIEDNSTGTNANNVIGGIDALAVPALNIGYQFHLKSKLSLGLDIRYSLGGAVTSQNGLTIPNANTGIPQNNVNQPGVNNQQVTGSYLQIIPNVGYNVIDDLRISVGLALSSFTLKYPSTGVQDETLNVPFSGMGIHAALEYDYFFNKNMGLKPKLSMEMMNYNSPSAKQNPNDQNSLDVDIFPASNIRNNIMSLSVDLVYKF